MLEYLQVTRRLRTDVLLVRSEQGNRVRSMGELLKEMRRRRHPDARIYVAAMTRGYYDLDGLTRYGTPIQYGPIVEIVSSALEKGKEHEDGRSSIHVEHLKMVSTT